GVSVAVVDAGEDAGDKIGESLAPSARPVLERLGVSEQLAAGGHLPCYGNRSHWGGEALDQRDFICNPYSHGWHLNRRVFEAMLRQEAARAGAVWVAGRLAGAQTSRGGAMERVPARRAASIGV